MGDDDLLMHMLLDDSDSDDELETIAILALARERLIAERRIRQHGGSVRGHAFIWRDRVKGHNKLFNDYFSENPVYPPSLFRKRFRMNRSLFLRIQSAVEAHDPYFVQKRNATGVLGLSCLQKMITAMKILSYGVTKHFVDDYVDIGESTAIECLKRFVKAVVAIFSDEYLRAPNDNDITRLLAQCESRGFPGMLGSIDCMHWKWKNCPPAWKGPNVHEPTILLEVVASYDLWIWHANFGLMGSYSDINVSEKSVLVTDLAEGRAALANYSVTGHEYTMGYYLASDIYPPQSIFVKTIPYPQESKQIHFAAAQELAMKNVEKAFGVLQARFAIVRGPTRYWQREALEDIMKACIIMHNMIVEDEYDVSTPDFDYDTLDEIAPVSASREHTIEVIDYIRSHHQIQETESHYQLQADLIEHLWQYEGLSRNM